MTRRTLRRPGFKKDWSPPAILDIAVALVKSGASSLVFTAPGRTPDAYVLPLGPDSHAAQRDAIKGIGYARQALHVRVRDLTVTDKPGPIYAAKREPCVGGVGYVLKRAHGIRADIPYVERQPPGRWQQFDPVVEASQRRCMCGAFISVGSDFCKECGL